MRFILFLAALFFTVCSAAVISEEQVTPVDISGTVIPILVNPLTSSINAFSVKLFNQLSQENEQNKVFVSPFSVSTAASMVLLGARSETAEELTRGLAFDQINAQSDGKTVYQMFHELLETDINNSTSVSLSNYLLIRKESDNAVLQKYKIDVQSHYGAQVDDVDFSEGAKIQTDVNNWVKNKTNGLIKSIMDSPADPATAALILNAIYFKGEWEQKFSNFATQNQTFFNKGVNGMETEFMSKTGKHFPYKEITIKNESVQVLEMKYEKDDMSMIIMLPRNKEGLSNVLSPSADGETEMKSVINNIQQGLQWTEMNLFIPKFKLETDYSLVPTLQQMGIRKPFTTEADLSGINGQRNLFVSNIKHKAVVKVDEDGTEAAAATMFDVYPTSLRVPYVPPTDFRADHPFLFLIMNRVTGLVYFIGKVEEL